MSALLQHIPCCISTAAGGKVWQVKRCLGSKLYISVPVQLRAGHCTLACLCVKWESYPSKVKSQECHFYKVLWAPQALQVPLKCLVMNLFINLEEILAVQINFSRYTKHVSCLILPFGILCMDIWVCRYQPHKFLLFPLCWAAACSQTGSCVKNRSAGTLDVQLCCTPFSQGQVLPTELLDVLREHKPLLPSADLLLLWCPAACPPVDSAHPSGEGWKSKTWSTLWIRVSIRKSAFGFLKIVYILFVKKWNG